MPEETRPPIKDDTVFPHSQEEIAASPINETHCRQVDTHRFSRCHVCRRKPGLPQHFDPRALNAALQFQMDDLGLFPDGDS